MRGYSRHRLFAGLLLVFGMIALLRPSSNATAALGACKTQTCAFTWGWINWGATYSASVPGSPNQIRGTPFNGFDAAGGGTKSRAKTGAIYDEYTWTASTNLC